MAETYYRRGLVVTWVVFVVLLLTGVLPAQSTWKQQGNLFDGRASNAKYYDPPEDLLSFIGERSDGPLPHTIRTAMTQAVVVKNDLGNGWAKGSGTYLGDGIYISAWHVVRDNPQGKVIVEWKDGKSYTAAIIGKEPLYDVVLLETSEKPYGGVPVSKSNATPGKTLFLAGYSQGPLKAWRGRATRIASPVGAPAADWTFATGAAISGDSGGPVIDETGCFIGPLWGSGGGETCFTNTGRVRRFLLPWNARLAAWQNQGYGCYGQCPPPQQPPSIGGGDSSGRVNVDDQPQTQPTQPEGNLGWPSGPPPIPQQPNNSGNCNCDNSQAIADAIKEALAGVKGAQGPAGPQGPKGDKGEPGPAGQLSEQQLAAVSQAIYEQLYEKLYADLCEQVRNDPALKGERGERGEPGEPGKPGQLTQSQLDQIKAEVLAAVPSVLPDTEVVFVDGATRQVIDRETYRPGEPLVFDFQKVLNAVKQQ